VVFGEKGLLRVKISGEETAAPSDFKFEGGTVVNIVPDEAHAFINGKEYSQKGKAAHGSLPHNGENAILKLAEKIVPLIKDSTFARLMCLTTAQSMNIDIKDTMTSLSINPSIVYADSKECSLSYDIRYPITADGEKVIENIKKAAEEKGLCTDIYFHEKPLYVPLESHLVKTLSEIYKEHTGDEVEPLAIGGGTYAKSFKNCVAFGVMFPNQPSTMHAPDEFWAHKDVKLNFDILADAIVKL
jgi:succinyl-diaminopimelate desuccinylase